jgi:putative drug exporter of the RND superfamily
MKSAITMPSRSPASSCRKWPAPVGVPAGTFATLGTLPLVILTEIGFCVAAGVLLDTIIVRAVLVTALNLDIGRWMWWPSGLARQPEVAEATSATSSAAVPRDEATRH